MRAMILPAFGEAGLFKLCDIAKPDPGVDELLVKVIASGTNPVDTKLRANGSWANLTPPVVLGYDASGIVEKIGNNITGFKIGDEIYYTPEIHGNQLGTYAEYNVVKASIVAKKPKGLSFEEAAAIPLAGGTAWEAIVRRLQICLGETILIQGAAGGVGTFAVQFAKATGAKVIATASPQNHQILKDLGADVVLDYHNDVIRAVLDETGGKGVDAAFDIQGDEVGGRCLPAVRPFGRIAVILQPGGNFQLLSFNNITMHGIFLMRESKRLEEMAVIFDRGLVHPIIDKILPLTEVSKAHERLDSGHGRGKIILKVS